MNFFFLMCICNLDKRRENFVKKVTIAHILVSENLSLRTFCSLLLGFFLGERDPSVLKAGSPTSLKTVEKFEFWKGF